MKIFDCNIIKSGIPRIEIPVKLNELNEQVILHYLPECISKLQQNAIKIRYLKDYTDGSYQPIDERIYEQMTSGNSQERIKENHAYEIVQFKEGFLLGDKKQFANKEGVDSDEMTYLEKFLSDVNYSSKDLELRHNVYSTGIGTSFIMPRADIFVEDSFNETRYVRYKKANEGYDVDRNSPFIYECLNSEENAVVYSSCIGESGLRDLFCFNVANVYDVTQQKEIEVTTVYTRDSIYEYRKLAGGGTLTKIGNNSIYGELPMVEHSLNKSRISPIEIVNDGLNAVNLLVSLEVNSVADKVNQLLAFLGCDLEDTDINELYKNGVICIPPSTSGSSIDVKAITNNLNYKETNVLVEQVLTRIFDIAGVPLATAAVSSGNNEAAYLGGGWTNASTIINRDIIAFEQSDREELKKWLKICKLNPQNPIKEIDATEIQIKYNVNQSNNLLAKTQSMQNLRDMNMPVEDTLKAVHLFGDIHNVAVRWQAEIDKAKREEQARAKQQTGDTLTGAQKQQTADQTIANQATSV